MWTLLEHVYFPNKQRTNCVSIFLNENPTPKMTIVNFSRFVMLNQIQWFTVVTFKDHIPKSEVYGLGDSRHTLSVYYGRYIRIMSEEVQMHLNKSEWSYLTELANSCIDKHILKFCRLYDDLIHWRNKCFESKSFCTPPETNAVDFETLCDDLIYKIFY
jgi:hypothetical protein